MERAATLRWQWAGHAAKGADRWSNRLILWRPWGEHRSFGRSQMGWEDDIKRTAGFNWYRTAQDRARWKTHREAYILRTENG